METKIWLLWHIISVSGRIVGSSVSEFREGFIELQTEVEKRGKKDKNGNISVLHQISHLAPPSVP